MLIGYHRLNDRSKDLKKYYKSREKLIKAATCRAGPEEILIAFFRRLERAPQIFINSSWFLYDFFRP